MNILLTGGTGFIGSYVLMALANEGHKITVLARNANKVPALKSYKNITILEVPITDYEGIKEAVKKKDLVVHIALNYNDETAHAMLINDTAPSIFLASEAAKAGVKHFIYTSSTAALDNVYSQQDLPFIGNTNCQVNLQTKQQPQSYYGATKAATENFLFAIGSQTGMRTNIIRPGYTFGNPVIEGAFAQPDSRFKDIVKAAVEGKDIELTKNDGTQFIWGGDLAKIYVALANSDYNKHTYFGLTNTFTSWQFIAEEAIKQSNSNSKLIINDLGWSDTPLMFDVSDYEKDFELSFSPYPHIQEHVSHFIKEFTK